MSEMVERIALILAKMYEEQSLSIKSEDNRNYLRAHIKVARAVIKAMREPTEEMKNYKDEFGDEFSRWDWNCYMCGGPKDNWYAMIDAALK